MKIKEEVFVNNGTQDKVHNKEDYPKITKEIPNGRFINMQTDESKREKLMRLVVLEFSEVTKDDGMPSSLAEFEKNIERNNQNIEIFHG